MSPEERRWLAEAVEDPDTLFARERLPLMDKLVELNLIVDSIEGRESWYWVDEPPPERDLELGVGKHVAWQTPLHREAVRKSAAGGLKSGWQAILMGCHQLFEWLRGVSLWKRALLPARRKPTDPRQGLMPAALAVAGLVLLALFPTPGCFRGTLHAGLRLLSATWALLGSGSRERA